MKKLELNLNAKFKPALDASVRFVVHKSSIVLLIIGIFFLGYIVYVWYQDVHHYEWDEVKKQEYMNNKNAGTNLNRVKFEKVLGDIANRKEEYEKSIDIGDDFFRLNKAKDSSQQEGEESSEDKKSEKQ